MADEVVAVLVEDISRILMSHFNLINNEAIEELQMLKIGLWLLKALAEKATGMREFELARQIKEVVYDVEDTSESWLMYSVAAAAKNKILRRFLMVQQGLSLARKIKSIRDGRLEPLNRRIRTYRDLPIVQIQPTEAREVRSEQPYIEVPSIKLYNIFEDDAETLIRNLMEETEQLDVISITGMPGIGKSMLARKIYQDQTIVRKFPTRIWVDIPLDFHSKNLYLNIIKGFISLDNPQGSCSNDSYIEILNEFEESGRISDDKLIDAVRSCLKKSRFLLVMDAVWTADTLGSIMHLLPKNGKVLITSRHNHITRKPYLLRFLNEKESWELLQLAVFGKLDDCAEMLKSTGECIAKSCDGSPLGIAVIANSLMVPSETAKDLTEKWWKKVLENVTMYVTDYCAHHNVFKSIEMSYIKLPQCLRNCFLYLGVFPGGHEIPVWTLTRLWIAEGLVQNNSRRGLSLEETAENNLYDLVNRNLVVVGKIYPNGQIKTCALHKLIYGFCKYKAAEQDFYHEIKIFKGGALDCPMPLTPNHRRLCIASCLSEFLSCGPKGQCVRSILCLNKADKEVLHPKSSSNIHKSFKLLKIFECKRIKFAKFPTKLSKLIYLRYISLSCDDLDVIPEAISSLLYLETMVVYTQSPSLKLKANIWRMPQLQHLVTKAAIVLAIRGRGEGGQNLQTLTRLAPECCEDVFRRAPNLNRLGVRGESTALLSSSSLNKFERLQHLKLINESSPPEIQLQPAPQCFPPNLKSLTLSATYLGWDSISILGNINTLEILKLKNNAFKGTSWNTNARGFCGLVFLSIRTADLVSWEASSADCFPRLKELVLKDCKDLKEIPSTLARTLNTMDVDVESVSASAVESARAISQQITQRQG